MITPGQIPRNFKDGQAPDVRARRIRPAPHPRYPSPSVTTEFAEEPILLAAMLQGAIFALVKAAVDRGAAEGTRRLTGTWPGDEGQQPDESA